MNTEMNGLDKNEMTGADYRKAIVDKVSEIKDIWLLQQIYRCICNVTKHNG